MSYEILGAIGAGGMGEVYRARDTKLNRDVAIKVLPEIFALDPDRLTRFTREAQTLAALNHPNIAAIYGVVDLPAEAGSYTLGSAAASALVMELVEGEDLSAMIARGPLPLDDALAIARQIADALEAAHELGIVHRDLKPANIKVRADGTVKVLDFGLAKAMDPAGGSGANIANSPTLTAHATAMGIIIGTAAYMAPEQARGKAVDRRADIWAFGLVVYEMLTGRRALQGEETSDVLAAVLRQDIDWSALPPDTPALLRALLQECLVRDPKQRLRDIGDARRVLDRLIAGAPGDAAAAEVPGAAKRAMSRWLPWAIAAMAIGVAAAAVLPALRRVPSASVLPVMHVTLSAGSASAYYGVRVPGIAISADGRTVVYMGESNKQKGLYLRRLDRAEATLIRGTEGAVAPFLSPDGAWVGFMSSDLNLKKVPIDGGAPTTLCPVADIRGASWGPDGFIVFSPNSQEGLWRVKDSGGAPERLTTRDAAKHEKTHRFPDVLPNGKGVLFMIGTTDVDSWDDSTIAVLPPSGGAPKPVVKGGMMPRYVAGYLVYAHGGDLVAAPFDLDRLEVTGPAVSVTSDVAMTSTMGVAEAAFSAAALAYLSGHESAPPLELIEADRAGVVRPVSSVPRTFIQARWLPDGQRVLLSIDAGNGFLWMLDVRRDSLSRLTFKNDVGTFAWNRATQRVLYGSVGGVLAVSTDGSGREDVVYRLDKLFGDLDVSPDGRFVIFGIAEESTGQLWLLDTTTGKAAPWLATRFTQEFPRFSPDGRWIAYTSNETGQREVYVRATSGVGIKVQVSTNGGLVPVWAPNGRELFYVDGARTRRADAPSHIWAADVRGENEIDVGAPHKLFAVPERSNFQDVSPDGQHFLFTQAQLPAALPAITFVSGWLEALKGKGPR